MTVEPIWSYWCPPEGTHHLHPQELQVGIVSVDDHGIGHALLVAAVIPPTNRRDYGSGEPSWCQNEPFARVTRDALIAETPTWNHPDGFAAGLRADGVCVTFPSDLPPLPDPREER
jgi:hypothetical protein